MLVTRNYTQERVIESYTISGVTRADMYKMTQVYDKVMNIIGNHLNKSAEKKEYLSDDDLYDIVSILDVLTENNRIGIKESIFEKRKEELLKMHKEIVDASVERPAIPSLFPEPENDDMEAVDE
jgi:hypothetical protein